MILRSWRSDVLSITFLTKVENLEFCTIQRVSKVFNNLEITTIRPQMFGYYQCWIKTAFAFTVICISSRGRNSYPFCNKKSFLDHSVCLLFNDQLIQRNDSRRLNWSLDAKIQINNRYDDMEMTSGARMCHLSHYFFSISKNIDLTKLCVSKTLSWTTFPILSTFHQEIVREDHK